MSNIAACPRCGARLTADQAREGSCPRCVLGLALEAGQAGPGSPEDASESPDLLDPNPDALTHDPESIGPYRIVRRLGAGGMGVVYLAEQTEPIRREVALKVIRKGLDTTTVMRRFEAERQALALMDHPAIARVLDAGETPEGRPYFVMEHVAGEPVTRYCDRNRLTTKERLDLFASICDGVQHAHRKGVIHRDLKPSNILVAKEGDVPKPKIIDFGIAKAIDRPLTERTLFTEIGVIVGTPEYMSPEQAALSAIEVDTRTDVYSLGVLLYELLVGALPFAAEDLRAAGFDEMRRRIREEDPLTPSARLSTLGARSNEAAQERQTDAAALRRQLQGDLDWITLKALEKDPGRRYGSPAELAADVGRWLRNEPILARPPSAWYLLGKLVARHRLAAVLVVSSVLTLTGFSVLMTLLYRQSQRNLHRALAAESEAEREAETVRRVSDFMFEVFEVSDPDKARGETVTARELLERGALQIGTTLGDRPEIRAELNATIAELYRKLGLPARARPLADDALKTFTRLRGEDDPRTLRAKNAAGFLHWNQGHWDEAEAVFRDAVARQLRTLGAEHLDTLETRRNLGSLLSSRGRHDEALVILREVLDADRRVRGEDHPETLKTMTQLAEVHSRQSRYEEAARLLEEVVATQRRALGNDHPNTLEASYRLEWVYIFQGHLDEAEPLVRESLSARQRVLGEAHPKTLSSMGSLAAIYARRGRYDEAASIYRRLIEIARQAGRTEHPNTLVSVANLAQVLHDLRRYDEAEGLLLRNIEVMRRVIGPDHPRTLSSLSNLANLYLARKEYDKAGRLYEETLARQRKALGPDHYETLLTLGNTAELHQSQGRLDLAEQVLVEVLAARERVLGKDHPEVASAMSNLAQVRRDRGDLGGAGPLFEEAQAIWDAKFDPGHPHPVINLREHAKLLRLQGDEAGAARLVAEADRREKQARKP